MTVPTLILNRNSTMNYHVLINTLETGELYEFDKSTVDEIKGNVITPYLQNQEFQFDGYFIEPEKVRRLVVTETNLSSNECISDAYGRLSDNVVVFYTAKDCVFGNDLYSNDVTRKVLQEVKHSIEYSDNKNSVAGTLKRLNKKNKTLFLAYSYRQIDDEFVSGFKDLLAEKGYEVIDGKADGLGSISQAIMEKISISDIAVIVMTKRDKKENGKFTTSAWLLEEKGAALALKKKVGMFVEEEIDEADIGGLQGDNQRFHFTRNNFLKVAMNFLKVIENE